MSELTARTYESLGGDLHRHAGTEHAHTHAGPHTHARQRHRPGHDHPHGLIDDSIKRSRDGTRAVLASLGVLGVTAAAQAAVFVASGSIALLADLTHNFGDALTAVPLGIAFALRSHLAERRAGLAVVAAIFVSACVAGVEAVNRLIHPSAPGHLAVLALAGLVGFAGTSSQHESA